MVTAHTRQDGYASLNKHSTDTKNWSNRQYVGIIQIHYSKTRDPLQSTHVKWVFMASSVAVLGIEDTNKVFLVYK